jgi:hypothetical protein
MRFRRALVTGALATLLVVGGAGAAGASSASNASRQDVCRVHGVSSRLQRQITRLNDEIRRMSDGSTSGRRARRLDKVRAHVAKAEHKLEALQAGCQS